MPDSNADFGAQPADDRQSIRLLIHQLLDDGDLSETDWQRLNASLKTSESLRRYYIDMVSIDRALLDQFDRSDDVTLDNFKVDFQEYSSGRPRLFSDQRGMSRWLIGGMATVLLLLLSAGILYFVAPTTITVYDGHLLAFERAKLGAEEELPHVSLPVARIDQAKQLRWQNDEASPVGTLIRPGTIGLTGGSIRLTFNTGTQVTLRGPACLQIIDSDLMILERGRASFHIPEFANSLEVNTKAGTITDLGTDFTAEVSPSTDSIRIGVSEGKVELSPENAVQPITVQANTAILYKDRSSQPQEFKEVITWNSSQLGNYRSETTTDYYRWNFNKKANLQQKISTESGTGIFADSGKHQTVNNSEAIASVTSKLKPEFTQGKYGTGVKFSPGDSTGTATGLTANLGDLDFMQPYSVCFWFKPADPTNPNIQSLLTVSPKNEIDGASIWEISLFADIAGHTETPDRLFLKTSDGTFAFPIHCFDDQWHHVAYIQYGNGLVDFPTENQLFLIDGRPVRPTSFDTADIAKSRKMLPTTSIAATLHFADSVIISDSIDHVNFVGSMDDVFYFNAALTAAQVQYIYSTGKTLVAKELLPTRQPPVPDPSVPFDWDYVRNREVTQVLSDDEPKNQTAKQKSADPTN